MTEPQTPQTVLTPEFHFPTGIYILEKPEYLDVVRKVSIESLEETRKQQKELNEIYPVCMSGDRKSTRLNSSHVSESRMPSSA